MCDADYSSEEPLANEWRCAGKAHRCFACREVIRLGDRYHFTAQLSERKFGSYKHCARCWELGKAILDAGAETFQYDLKCGVSWEEAFGEPPPERVAALAFLTPEEAQAKIEKESR